MTELVIVHRPEVAQAARKTPTAMIVVAFAALGLSIFLWLSAARASSQSNEGGLPLLAKTVATDTTMAPPPPLKPTTEPAPT